MVSRGPIWRTTFVTVAAEKNNNLEQVLQYCDWGYTDEGSKTFSFGIEGETYEMIDGNPFYISPYGEGWENKRAVGIDNCACYYLDPAQYNQSLMGGVASVDEMDPISALNYQALYDNEDNLYIPSPSFSTKSSIEFGDTLYEQIESNVDKVIMGKMTVEEFYTEYEQIKENGFSAIATEMAEAYKLVSGN
jgi:putative aldouronate transport system substrate-binding protein